MTQRVLHVVTNVAHRADPSEPTGLWLSEPTHAHEIFAAQGYEQRIASPNGGIVSSVCHGYCGLLNTTLSDGTLLVA